MTFLDIIDVLKVLFRDAQQNSCTVYNYSKLRGILLPEIKPA